MAVYGIIPARLNSTRLPRKMLLDATGKPFIEHTWENVKQAKSIDTALVATDSQEIALAVRGFGGTAIMTPPCRTGSDRAYAALDAAKIYDADIVVNVQGDWPEINPDDIDSMVSLMSGWDGWDIATLAGPLEPSARYDHRRVKVVYERTGGGALYFSRGDIPGDLHYGVYAYTAHALKSFAEALQTPLELDENLEQLRALEIGLSIRVLPTQNKAYGIDTQADYDAFVERMKSK